MNTARDRNQLVIGLGEGEEGRRVREILDAAAADAGKPVTTWARDTLLAATGGGPEDPIVTVNLDEHVTQLDLRTVSAVRGGHTVELQVLIPSGWAVIRAQNPDEIAARWKRVKRGA